MSNACDFCDSPSVRELKYDEKLGMGRKRVLVAGLLKTKCEACGEEYVTEEQLEHNHALYEAASTITAEVVTVGQLRSFRARWGLTQRAASALFGAGESAFGKWESGQLPSGPAALLLQCSSHVPGVTEYLAKLQHAVLPTCPEMAEWHKISGEVTGVLPAFMHVKKPAAPGAKIAPKCSLPYQANVIELYGRAA